MSDGSPSEVFGPYLVYEQLGIGGMAQVHRAIAAQGEVQRSVALKRMLSHIAGNDEMVKSFVREARLASYLRHENVAQTYDLGRVGDIYFIVMELITGRNLREVLRHCGGTTGPMPVKIALNILNQICDALDYAHNLADETGAALGIIHRDVSPSNVIVADSGVVKLIDFGIAKASGAGMQTMGGTLKGKFGYMAPEYIAGRIDARADLFAVGVIAHELLTNRPLFSGRDDIDTLTRVRDMHIDPPSVKNPQVPPEIDDIVMTALARDPDRRWQHATALRTALTTLTKRLDLVATNTQVVEWLDWAFAQQKKRKAGADTERDDDPLADDPSISIEQHTVDLGSISKKSTLLMEESAPPPPRATPRATSNPGVEPRLAASSAVPANVPRARSPSSVPGPRPHAPTPHAPAPLAHAPAPLAHAHAQAPLAHAHAPAPLAHAHAPAPLVALPASSPTIAGTASAIPAPRAHSPSSAPLPHSQVGPLPHAPRAHAPSAVPLAAPGAYAGNYPAQHRTHPASVPPPVAAQTARASQAPGAPQPGASAPHPLQLPNASAPHPVVPTLNSAPFAAPRPAALGSAAMPFDPARQAAVQRELAERMPPATAGGASPALVVVLVILAAAVAATTVYFVLPLLT